MTTQFDIATELLKFGAARKEIIELDVASPEVLSYLDLVRSPNQTDISPKFVVEIERRPVVYVVDGTTLSKEPTARTHSLALVRRNLASRGDADWVAILEPGQVSLYRNRISTRLPDAVVVSEDDTIASTLIRDLAAGLGDDLLKKKRRKVKEVEERAVHELLVELLSGATDELLALSSLKAIHKKDSALREAVLSLIGRALFARFLIDRGILNEKTFPALYRLSDPIGCFDDAERSALTSHWLDDKFNGELLPLTLDGNYNKYFTGISRHGDELFKTLSKITHGTRISGQMLFDWSAVNFGHVPIGLLSEVYEHYAHAYFSDPARAESIHYTPAVVADFMVNSAFDGLPSAERAKARILDPAAGTGIFLVLALRRLVAESWRLTGFRPSTKDIREIIRNQIRGFDINVSALRLAALSLYLTALELDENAAEASNLRVPKLHGTVLVPTRQTGEEFPSYPILGSLGPAIGDSHNGRYDIVISNPPWTAWKGKKAKPLVRKLDHLVRRIAKTRLEISDDEAATLPANPDHVPDLPFFWRSMEWAKSDGVLAFALHGRLLFKRREAGAKARDLLFQAAAVTGVLNGAALGSAIWPNMNQPFCLLFARNRRAARDQVFRFSTPHKDSKLAELGRFRIDYKAAQPVAVSVLAQKPYVLKSLHSGTSLDCELVGRLEDRVTGDSDGEISRGALIRLGDYWTEKKGLFRGDGFQNTKSENPQSAKFLRDVGARQLSKKDNIGFYVEPRQLQEFRHATLHRTRTLEQYLPPLVLISEAPGPSRSSCRARISLKATPIAFTESFYGLSSAKHDRKIEIAKYLFVVANSDLFLYYHLLTSAKFGSGERRLIYKEDIEAFPMVPFEHLTDSKLSELRDFADNLENADERSWRALNRWVYQLFSLDESDAELIDDTLATQLPYKSMERFAESAPDATTVRTFCDRLRKALIPFFSQTNEPLDVKPAEVGGLAWRFIDIHATNTPTGGLTKPTLLAERFAEASGATRIMFPLGESSARIGILAQRRYWTKTRARLCAIDLLRELEDVFPIPVAA